MSTESDMIALASPSRDLRNSLPECLGYRVDSLASGRLGFVQGIREGTGSDGEMLVVSVGSDIGRSWLIPTEEVHLILHVTRQIVVRSSRNVFRSVLNA